ncbi:hypothetical protein KLP28_03715 [Nocardioidaceae bacterium]|nr:hypothetical protein KLP28_03715 [Nocardioidaceae bacterium]
MSSGTAPVSVVDAPSRDRPTVSTLIAAGCCGLAGFLHIAAFPDHFFATPALGATLLVVGVGQLLATLVLLDAPGPRTVAFLAWTHMMFIAAYVATRTMDIPLMPLHVGAGHVDAADVAAAAPGSRGNGIPVYPGSRIEPVGTWDLLCVLAEAALVVLLVRSSPGPHRRALVDGAVLLTIGLLVLRLTTGS